MEELIDSSSSSSSTSVGHCIDAQTTKNKITTKKFCKVMRRCQIFLNHAMLSTQSLCCVLYGAYKYT